MPKGTVLVLLYSTRPPQWHQCYAGSGIQARIKKQVPHCYAHYLNLMLVNTIRDIPHTSRVPQHHLDYVYFYHTAVI